MIVPRSRDRGAGADLLRALQPPRRAGDGRLLSLRVGFRRQCWQIHHLSHWCGDAGWVKECISQYRRFVYRSDVVELSGTVTAKRVVDDGEHVVDIETRAVNQRGENVMPGTATVALPIRGGAIPAALRVR